MLTKRRTLVVGLGGTGCFSLRFAKQRLLEICERSPGKPLGPVKFLAIDLDERSRKESLGRPMANIDEEFVLLRQRRVEQKVKTISAEENRIYWSWYPDKRREVLTLGRASQGAGQWRALGRLAYCEHRGAIEGALMEALRELERMPFDSGAMDTRDVDVFILCSAAGGTGSGMLLDIAYFLQDSEAFSDRELRVHTAAFVLMPTVFEEVDKGHRAHANSYACLMELQAFYQQDRDFEMHYPTAAKARRVTAGTAVPFSHLYLFDNELSDRSMSREECYEYIGNMVYLRMTTEVGSAARSAFANVAIPPSQEGLEEGLLEGGFVFSSCSGAMIELPGRNEIGDILLRRACADLERPERALDEGTRRAIESAAERLLPDLGSFDAAAAWQRVTAGIEEEIGEIEDADRRLNLARLVRAGRKLCDLDWRSGAEEEVEQWASAIEDAFADTVSFESLREAARLTDGSQRLEAFLHLLHLLAHACARHSVARGDVNGSSEDPPDKDSLGMLQKQLRKDLAGLGEIRVFFLRKLLQPRKHAHMKASLWPPYAPDRYRSRGLEGVRETTEKMRKALEGGGASRGAVLLDRAAAAVRSGVADRWRELFEASHVSVEADLKTLKAALSQRSAGPARDSTEALNVYRLSRAALDEAIQGPVSEIEGEIADTLLDQVVPPTRPLQPDTAAEQSAISSLTEEQVESLAREFERTVVARADRGDIALDPEPILENLGRLVAEARVFLFKNLRPNPCLESQVFYSVPRITGFSYPFGEKKHWEHLDASVKSMTKRVFMTKSPPQRLTGDDSRIVIYFETHHHPGANIANVLGMKKEYRRVGFDPQMLHVHRSYKGLPQLVTGELQQVGEDVLCGNPGCHFDIAGVPREVLLCPSCDRAILNRCGNQGCDADDLVERLGGLDRLDSTFRMCPICKRSIRTFWWDCDLHGPQWRLHDEPFCLDCNSAATQQEMKFADRRRQPTGRLWGALCIGCKREAREQPHSVPAPELYYGVPPEREQYLLSLLADGRNGNECPVCSSALFPVCPHGSDSQQHFVEVLEDGTARCDRYKAHGEAVRTVRQCLSCLYPLRGDEGRCPRCKLEVVSCPHCSAVKNLMIPRETVMGGDRCPICKYEVSFDE